MFVLAALAFALTIVPAASAGQGAPAPSPLTLAPASGVGPSQGGPASRTLGYLPLHAPEFARAKAAADARARSGKPAGPAVVAGGTSSVSSYTNVSPSFNGTYWTGGTPPDTTGAIGPERYIETVNTQYAIYSRLGSLVNTGSLSSLTGIPGGFFGYSLSDPQMMWDAKTQRFYYSAV